MENIISPEVVWICSKCGQENCEVLEFNTNDGLHNVWVTPSWDRCNDLEDISLCFKCPKCRNENDVVEIEI